MGENCGTWTHQVQFSQSPNLNSFCAPFDMGKQNAAAAAMNPGVDMNMNSRNEAVPPAYASSALPYMQSGHLNEPHGWFYCLPRFRQGFTCPPNLISEDKLPNGSHLKGFKEETTQNRESGFPQKQFLVIDQTGDQTTLIYSSRFGRPVECLGSWDSKFHGCNNLNANNEPSLRRDVNHVVGVEPTFDYKVDENENQGTEIESEMHEDTEEINALLYSDSDGYSTEDDEVTSTGHSPSTTTTHDNQDPYGIGGIAEEVASSSPGKTKKRKLFDVAYDDVQFMDTANSLKRNQPCDLNQNNGDDNDAESRCSGSNYGQGSGEMGSLACTKKMRKEKIQNVLSILQCIVPNGKDKNPIQLLDDAIRCLNSLKLKARALGLNAL
ncbi:hypothetical protein RYX36_006882 [Vicia faba]